jgi:hypothetical protein
VPAILASPQNLAAVAYRRLWAEVEDRLDLEHRAQPVINLTTSAGRAAASAATAAAEAG